MDRPTVGVLPRTDQSHGTMSWRSMLMPKIAGRLWKKDCSARSFDAGSACSHPAFRTWRPRLDVMGVRGRPGHLVGWGARPWRGSRPPASTCRQADRARPAPTTHLGLCGWIATSAVDGANPATGERFGLIDPGTGDRSTPEIAGAARDQRAKSAIAKLAEHYVAAGCCGSAATKQDRAWFGVIGSNQPVRCRVVPVRSIRCPFRRDVRPSMVEDRADDQGGHGPVISYLCGTRGRPQGSPHGRPPDCRRRERRSGGLRSAGRAVALTTEQRGRRTARPLIFGTAHHLTSSVDRFLTPEGRDAMTYASAAAPGGHRHLLVVHRSSWPPATRRHDPRLRGPRTGMGLRLRGLGVGDVELSRIHYRAPFGSDWTAPTGALSKIAHLVREDAERLAVTYLVVDSYTLATSNGDTMEARPPRGSSSPRCRSSGCRA